MTVTEHIITIGVIALGTMLTRFLPFIVFPADKPTPKFITYLGKYLPPAIFGFLVIYCLKDVYLEKANAAFHCGWYCNLYAACSACVLKLICKKSDRKIGRIFII